MEIKRWRPTFLLNTDNKLIFKALGKRIKKLLSSLDILEVRNILKIKGFLSKVVFEKAFDLVNHVLIFHALEKFAFGKNFMK